MKATFKASARLLRAALVVRLLAFVATLIPRNPAKPEANAPTTNDKDINALESVLPAFAIPSKSATTTINIPNIRYSAFKNAIAPSAILLPINTIRSVP